MQLQAKHAWQRLEQVRRRHPGRSPEGLVANRGLGALVLLKHPLEGGEVLDQLEQRALVLQDHGVLRSSGTLNQLHLSIFTGNDGQSGAIDLRVSNVA